MVPKDQLKFLNNFEPRFRGPVVNVFLDPIRRGIDRNHKIVEEAYHIVKKKIEYPYHEAWLDVLYQLLDKYIFDPKEVEEDMDKFMEYYLWYEKLPREEKERIKEDKQQKGRYAWMASQPATEPQKRFCLSLGYDQRKIHELTKLSASEFIAERQRRMVK